MRRRALTMLVAAASIATLAGCVGPPAPHSTEPPPTPSASATELSATVEVYFAHSQSTRLTLISENHELRYTGDLLETALAGVIAGTIQPIDPDYTNLWGDATALRSLSREGDILTVDLEFGGLTVGAEAEGIAIAQLVWTSMAIDPTIGALAITVDGQPVETLAGHVDTSGLLGRDAAESILTPVQIMSIVDGDLVTNPVQVSGVACVFEATVSWQLRGPGGEQAEGFTMAAEACPARGRFTIDLGSLAPGVYELTVIEYSMKDGSIASSDSKRFTVE